MVVVWREMTGVDGPTAVWILWVLGFALLANGIAFRMGFLRYQASQYWRPDWPMVLRNGPFAQIPLALTALLIAGAITARGSSLNGIVILLAFGMFSVGLATIAFPPPALKPAWIRRGELEKGRPIAPSPAERGIWLAFVGLISGATLLLVLILLLNR
jgi:hypothetical protein